MNESPKSLGPPPNDFVLSRSGVDTPTLNAFALYALAPAQTRMLPMQKYSTRISQWSTSITGQRLLKLSTSTVLTCTKYHHYLLDRLSTSILRSLPPEKPSPAFSTYPQRQHPPWRFLSLPGTNTWLPDLRGRFLRPSTNHNGRKTLWKFKLRTLHGCCLLAAASAKIANSLRARYSTHSPTSIYSTTVRSTIALSAAAATAITVVSPSTDALLAPSIAALLLYYALLSFVELLLLCCIFLLHLLVTALLSTMHHLLPTNLLGILTLRLYPTSMTHLDIYLSQCIIIYGPYSSWGPFWHSAIKRLITPTKTNYSRESVPTLSFHSRKSVPILYIHSRESVPIPKHSRASVPPPNQTQNKTTISFNLTVSQTVHSHSLVIPLQLNTAIFQYITSHLPIKRPFPIHTHIPKTLTLDTALSHHSPSQPQKSENPRHGSTPSPPNQVSSPPNSTPHTTRVTNIHQQALTMSVYSSLSGSISVDHGPTKGTAAPYRPAILHEPEIDAPGVNTLLMGWVRAQTIAPDMQFALNVSSSISNLLIKVSTSRVFLISAPVLKSGDRSIPSLPIHHQLFSGYLNHVNYRLIGIQAVLPDPVSEWPMTRVQFQLHSSTHFTCHPIHGDVPTPFSTPSIEYIALFPSYMDHRVAHSIANFLFENIATAIDLKPADFLCMPGPPGASDTPVKTFCFVTRHTLDDSVRNTILAVASANHIFGDPSDIHKDACAVLRIQFNAKNVKLLSGRDNLANVNAQVRADATNHLWIILNVSPSDLTPELIHQLTNVEVDPWWHTTKFAEYTCAVGPTDTPSPLINDIPQISHISTGTYKGYSAVLPRSFPNEYQIGQGRVESYLGAFPPHFVHFLPPSGDPSDIPLEHYIFMPEHLRARLFIQKLNTPIPQVPLNTPAGRANQSVTSQSTRRNTKALQLPRNPPAPAQQLGNQNQPAALANPPAQQHQPPCAIPPRPQAHPLPVQADPTLATLLARFQQLEQQTHNRLTLIEGQANDLISNSIRELNERINLHEANTLGTINHLRDTFNAAIDRIFNTVANHNDDITTLRSQLTNHIHYLYYLNNANPNQDLPALPPLEEEYQHVFSSAKTEFSPFKDPSTNVYPMDTLPLSTIRTIYPKYFSYLLTLSQVHPVRQETLPSVVVRSQRVVISNKNLTTRNIHLEQQLPRRLLPRCLIKVKPTERPLVTQSFHNNSNHYSSNPNPPTYNTQLCNFTPILNPYTSPQIIIISLNTCRYYHRHPFPPNAYTIADLLHHSPPFLHLPTPYRLSVNNLTLSPTTPLHHLNQTITQVNIILPIRGGSNLRNSSSPLPPSPLDSDTLPQCPTPHLPSTTIQPTNKKKTHRGPKLTRPLTRQGYTIRVATFNCNGCTKNNPHERHQLLWNFVHSNKIDVLFLIDHRSSLRSLNTLKDHGSRYLNSDIRLIASDITLLHKPTSRSDPLCDYHSTVGGCAILTFGSLAHITFPTSFSDPSGAATFIGAKIVPHSSLPPVFLNAIYLFPPTKGPTTISTRIASYLQNNNIRYSPCQWQRSLISQLLRKQYDEHPNCAQIVGGDFNHRDWHIPNHPVSRTFLNDLQLQNTAYDAVHLNSTLPQPVTYLNTNTWIDHILHTGKSEVKDFCDYRNDLITTYSDHAPYSNDIYISLPTIHYNIPNNLHTGTQQKLRATHIRKHDILSKERYTRLCQKHLSSLTPNTDNWSPKDHEHHYNKLCSSLVKMAKSATKLSIRTSMPALTKWSPELAFLYKFIKLIKSLLDPTDSQSTPLSPPHNHNSHTIIENFIHHHYTLTKTINNTPTTRYQTIIHKLFPQYPRNIIPPSTDPNTALCHLLHSCRNLCHARHQQEMRSNINTRIKAHEQARSEGKLKNVISWILEKDSPPRFSTTVTANNIIKAIPYEAHNATLSHFTKHFSCHPWITTMHLNERNPLGDSLRQSLLQGTWRHHFPSLVSTLESRHREYAAAYFDNFAYKATQNQRQTLAHITSRTITFENFYSTLLQRCGNKSPGPTGLTLSILQNTPLPILQHLHSSLLAMWNARHIPSSWQARELALLPKTPTSITLNEMRPLMLLEVLRKHWLHLILKPISLFLNQQALICPYQVGGIPNSGTEDAILQIINSLEDSSERAENIEILAFDKAKAFDSPGRICGIALAWQRMGIPQDIAEYIADCDNSNQIFPRTPYYLSSLSKHPSLAFHAEMGTPQGCSSASLSYLVVEDIILSTFQSQLHSLDPYLARDPSGFLFPQPPTQFVDDTYVFCRTTKGAQNAINLLQTAEPILNIRINPIKTRHFSLQWSPPIINTDPHFRLLTPTPALHAYSQTGTPITITPIPLSTPTRVLGAFIAPDLSSEHVHKIKTDIKRIKTTMTKKKASLTTIWSVLKTSVFPKFTYLLKFTNLSMQDLDVIAGPFRDLIRRKANASHLPNAILFGGACAPYSLPYHDLMQHTLKDKESTMLRMLSGHAISRQTITSLLSRGYRLISDHITFNNSPLPCPLLPPYQTKTNPAHYCWALSLIQYLQAAQSNLHITPPFPASHSNTVATQTPIHSLFSSEHDSPLTLTDIHEFESSYHLYFVEELFSFPAKSAIDTYTSIFPLFHNKYASFLYRIINTALGTPHLTLGTLILRDHIILNLPHNNQPHYLEGLIYPTTASSPPQALTRSWSLPKRNNSQQRIFLRLSHDNHLNPNTLQLPLYEITTSRYIHSSIGYTSTFATCKSTILQQHILPRTYPPSATLYTQPELLLNFPPQLNIDCNRINTHSNFIPNVYTDGSLKPPPSPLTLIDPQQSPAVSTSVIFSTTPSTNLPWAQRDVTAIRITFPTNTTADNYTAEMLGVATATSLPFNHAAIYTDAKGIVTSISKTLQHSLSQSAHLSPHLSRNYTETGLLYKHIILNNDKITLHHIKAHQEDSPSATSTEHGTGNRIADLIAQGDSPIAQTLCRSLTISNYELNSFIQPSLTPPIISIGKTPSPHDFSFHHPNVTAKHFHLNNINQWLNHVRPHRPSHSHLQWENLTWFPACTAINKHSQHPSTRIFLFKTLYNALPNAYTKHKYSTNSSRNTTSQPSTPNDLPLCPLCSTDYDSLSHLLCACTHNEITPPLRSTTINRLRSLASSTHPNNPAYFLTQLVTTIILSNFTSDNPDHRTLLGLLHAPTLLPHITNPKAHKKLLANILTITAPFIVATWKTYNTLTHQSHHSSPTLAPVSILPKYPQKASAPRLLIISGNNGSLSLQQVHDHLPRQYTSKQRKPPPRLNPPHHLPPNSLITSHFTSKSNQLPASQPLPPLTPTTITTDKTHNPTYIPASPILPPTLTTNTPSSQLPFVLPKYPIKTSTPPTPTTPQPTPKGIPPQCSNRFSPLEVFDINNSQPLLPPYQHIALLHTDTTTPIHTIFNKLSLIPHDVPQNGDCFYLTIQLFLSATNDPPILAPIPYLRTSISSLLTTTTAGHSILADYHQSPDILSNTLPSLRPEDYPSRDPYAQDYIIAAMATLLNTNIYVYTTLPDSSHCLYTFSPYPGYQKAPLLPSVPPISIWAVNTHFQLLLHNTTLPIPSITSNLLPLPYVPIHNTTNLGLPITIPPSPSQHHQPHCPFQPQPEPTTFQAFCAKTCNAFCPNHHSGFRTIPHQRMPPHKFPSQLIATAGVSAHTPIFEIASTIISPTPTSVPITITHHSDALTNHPLIQLMHSSDEPNCHLEPILIPEPSPHLLLFVVTLIPILPYESIRIRPPPPPPPKPPPTPRPPPGQHSTTSNRSLITSYYQRLPR